MAEIAESPTQRKRSFEDLVEPLLSNEASSPKRPCVEAPAASAHLTLLEEFCDLEGDDAESSLESSSSAAAVTQEDLVAEMMKSLEKVIEESDGRAPAGEASTSHHSSGVPSPPPLDDTYNSVLDGIACNTAADPHASFHGELHHSEEFMEDMQIRQILQVSDDELGIPLSSSSSSDFEDGSLHEEWAFLSDHGIAPAALSFSWLDAPLQQLEEARDLYEPVTLF